MTEFNASQSMAGLATGIFVLASLVGRISVGLWKFVAIGVYYLIFRKKENNQAVNVKEEQQLG